MANPKPPKIIIIGCGIGGLVTALQLHADNLRDVHIFEAASTLSTLGVGINVQPSAVLLLRNLGLLPALLSTGIKTQELNYYDRHGNPIVSELRGEFAGYHVPQLSIHRGELQMLLLSAVKERLGESRVHLDHCFDSYEQEQGGDRITARFIRRKDRANPPEVPEMTGNLLIAADGINSAVRKLFYPSEGPPQFSGRLLWRGCLEREPYLTGGSMVWAGHKDQKFIAYPISSRAQRRGKSLVNWIAELRVRAEDDPDKMPPSKSDWTQTVEKTKFAPQFDKWTFGFLGVPELIRDTDKVYEFPMCDRDPVEQWAFHRLVLLGDAAHPMYPIGSNGASQAILDAAALTRHLTLYPGVKGVPGALRAYEAERIPVTTKIVMANRGNGPDQVLQVAHERAPNGFDNIYDVVPREELEEIGRAYKKLAGFDLEAVNKKADDTEGWAEILGLKPPTDWVEA